jgi:hypothetical protein
MPRAYILFVVLVFLLIVQAHAALMWLTPVVLPWTAEDGALEREETPFIYACKRAWARAEMWAERYGNKTLVWGS